MSDTGKTIALIKALASGGGSLSDVEDVQINGTSIVSGGVANIESDDLNFKTAVSGSTPSITGVAGMRYVCGEVSTISITPPQSGIIDVVFESGSTPAVLTVPNTVIWNDEDFDPTSLEANTVYELNIMDGIYGAVGKWTD